MKRIWIRALALGLAVYSMPTVHAISREPPPGQESRSRRAGASKTTLARAIEIALLEVPGEALQARIEVESGKAIIEVTVFAKEKTFEVEIDGETGRILEVEAEDGEDDDGQEDDGAGRGERP